MSKITPCIMSRIAECDVYALKLNGRGPWSDNIRIEFVPLHPNGDEPTPFWMIPLVEHEEVPACRSILMDLKAQDAATLAEMLLSFPEVKKLVQAQAVREYMNTPAELTPEPKPSRIFRIVAINWSLLPQSLLEDYDQLPDCKDNDADYYMLWDNVSGEFVSVFYATEIDIGFLGLKNYPTPLYVDEDEARAAARHGGLVEPDVYRWDGNDFAGRIPPLYSGRTVEVSDD